MSHTTREAIYVQLGLTQFFVPMVLLPDVRTYLNLMVLQSRFCT